MQHNCCGLSNYLHIFLGITPSFFNYIDPFRECNKKTPSVSGERFDCSVCFTSSPDGAYTRTYDWVREFG
jgi:hypothetical protein